MPRIVAIDYGVRRTGIAVTDSLQLIATGLCTVETRELIPFLKAYVEKEPVERIVIGLPRQPNGADSDNLPRVRAFAERLAKEMPAMPIDWWDERYTSVMAHQAMIDGGLGKKARRNKALVDEIAATIILQGYMERRTI